MNDDDIIKGCLVKDRASQKALYERFYSKMMGVCMRYARDRDEAKDMVQEGFIKTFNKVSSFTGNGSLEGWVRRIMVNNAIDMIRKNKGQHMISSTYDPRHLPSDSYEETQADDDDIFARVTKEEILRAVQNLTPAYRTVFNLYVIDEYSHKEIAEMLNISEGTSKSNLAKARFNLRKQLSHLVKIKI